MSSPPGKRPPVIPKHLGLGSMLGEVDPFAGAMLGDPRASNAHASRFGLPNTSLYFKSAMKS